MVDVQQKNSSQVVNVVTETNTQSVSAESSTSSSSVEAQNNKCKYYEQLALQHATDAQNSATSASNSATSASNSATSAGTSATNAQGYANNASTSATNASESEDNAEIWAEGTDAQVQALGGTHSSKEWADKYSHVYIGTTSPTDDEVDVWINPDGTDTPYLTDVKVDGSSVVTSRVANIDLTGKQNVISDLSDIRTHATHGESAYNTISGYGNIVTHNTSEFQVVGDYATNTALTQGLATKENTISDLSTIRSNATNGQSAYTTISGYGNIVTHNASEFYLATNPSGYQTATQVNSAITTALNGYATQSWVEGKGYITGITSSDVTTALGFTPYNATNPNNYISQAVDDSSTTSTTLGWSASKLNTTIGNIETLLQALR